MIFNFDRMTSLMNNTYDTPNSSTIWVSWKSKVWYGCQMSLNINRTKKSIYCLAMCWIKDKNSTGNHWKLYGKWPIFTHHRQYHFQNVINSIWANFSPSPFFRAKRENFEMLKTTKAPSFRKSRSKEGRGFALIQLIQ